MEIDEYKKEFFAKDAKYNSICPREEKSINQDQTILYQYEEMKYYRSLMRRKNMLTRWSNRNQSRRENWHIEIGAEEETGTSTES